MREKDFGSAKTLMSVGAEFVAGTGVSSDYTHLLFLLSRGMVLTPLFFSTREDSVDCRGSNVMLYIEECSYVMLYIEECLWCAE